jgi:hypothetical protein
MRSWELCGGKRVRRARKQYEGLRGAFAIKRLLNFAVVRQIETFSRVLIHYDASFGCLLGSKDNRRPDLDAPAALVASIAAQLLAAV